MYMTIALLLTIRVLKGAREITSLSPPPYSEWRRTKTKSWEKEDKILSVNDGNQMEAVAWCESLTDLLTGFKLSRFDLSVTGDAAWDGPTPPPAHSLGRMVLPRGDWDLEEFKRILLLVGSLLSENQNGDHEQNRNAIFPEFTNQISHSSTRREEVRTTWCQDALGKMYHHGNQRMGKMFLPHTDLLIIPK